MSLQTIVTKSPLTQEEKDAFLSRIETEGQTPELMAEIKDALQSFIDSGFKDLGVELDQNDPRVKSANQQFDASLTAAKEEFDEEMDNANIDAAVLQAKTNKSLDAMQINSMKARLAA